MRFAGLLIATVLSAEAETPSLKARIRVPATANPYLAGMPTGTHARQTDVAPDQSPVQANLPPGSVLTVQGEDTFDPAVLPDAERWEARKYGRNVLLFWEPPS